MIVFAALIALVFINKTWVRIVAGIAWVLGLIANFYQFPMYLIASAMLAIVFLAIRGIIRTAKKTQQRKRERGD